MAFLPASVAAGYNPLSGLVKPPPGVQRSSGTPTAPGAGDPSLNTGTFTPATSTPAAPGGITVGGTPAVPGFTPDYKSLIASDPGLLQAEAGLQASGVANLADRNAAFQTNVIDYGQLPDLNKAASALGLSASDLQSILGPDVGKLAQENTQAGTSILARLNAANAKTIEGIKNSLAARGIYRSGETGYQLGQQNQAYTNSQYDATKSLLGSLAGLQNSYVSAEQARQMALAQAASDAADRVQREYPGNPGTPAVPGTTANWVGADTAGQNVYQDSNGYLYNPDGTPYSGPALQGQIGLGTGPNRPDAQSTASHIIRHGI